MASRPQKTPDRPQRRSAFTMIELMVSVAIALVLILGVNEVFKIAAQTVGAGQAFSAITRDERCAHFSFYTDVHNAMTVSQPALLISSQRTYAFNSQQDFSNEPSGDPSKLTLNNVTPTTPNVSNILANSRNFRIDTLGFFASGDLYQRQTADTGSFVSQTTGSNAYIWYGHVKLPNNDQAKSPAGANPGWFDPGQADSGAAKNDNNRYAAEWILGRMAMLMVPTPTGASYTAIQAGASGNPLASDAAGGGFSILTSRYDIVNASVAQFNTAVSAYMTANPTTPLGARDGMFFRYQADPFPVKPLTASNMSAVAPIFLAHCSQFIVEYAGDYITQHSDPTQTNYGQIDTTVGNSGAQGDSVLDFIVDKSQDPAGTNPALWIRKIRWYGFPRDTNGDGAIDWQHDVVPLRDVLDAPTASGGAGLTKAAPWEYGTLIYPTNSPPVATPPATPNTPPANYVGVMSGNEQYFCSWGSESQWPVGTGPGTGLPRMLRITLSLDDPSGRLATPQIYEYVIDLGAQQ